MSSAPDENSTFSRLMNTRVAQVDRLPDGQVGAVVIFTKGTTVADAEEALRELDIVESSNVQEFNPEYGSPVFYIP
jgi:hypothetical protein